MRTQKSEIISFKADRALLDAMEGIGNRSEFIRAAVLAALASACPLCRGAGILTPSQKDHWDRFAEHHQLRKCSHCHELHLVCGNQGAAAGRRDERHG